MSARSLCLRAPVSTTGDLASIVESRPTAWTVEELSRLLQTSTKFVYSQVRRNLLPAYRIGPLLRLDPATTAAWLRSRTTAVQHG